METQTVFGTWSHRVECLFNWFVFGTMAAMPKRIQDAASCMALISRCNERSVRNVARALLTTGTCKGNTTFSWERTLMFKTRQADFLVPVPSIHLCTEDSGPNHIGRVWWKNEPGPILMNIASHIAYSACMQCGQVRFYMYEWVSACFPSYRRKTSSVIPP